MRSFSLKIGAAFAALGMIALASAAPGSDWTQFRGPERDGISSETGLVRTWGEDGPRELWRRPIGVGFSAIAAVGERIYTLDADPVDGENPKEYALALDAASGETIWRRPVGALFRNAFGAGPRSGPTWHAGRLYVVSSMGNFHALDAETGEAVWSVDFQERFDAKLPTWAFTSAPLVIPDLGMVVVEAGGSEGRAVAAFGLEKGDVRWTAIDDKIVYSSPVLVELGGVRQLVFSTQSGLHALDLDGQSLWRASFVPELDIKPTPPVFVAPDLFFVSASYDAGAKVVRVEKTADGFQAEDVWEHRRMRNHFNGSVVLGHHLIGFDKAILKCIDARNGEEAWAARGYGKGSLIRAGELLILLSERGELALAEASVENFEELASHQVLTGRSWTQPTLSNGRLYVRNGTEIVALDLRAGGES